MEIGTHEVFSFIIQWHPHYQIPNVAPDSDKKISWVPINEVAGSNVHRVRDFIDAKCILLKICGCHDTHGTHANAPSQGYVHSKPTLKEFWHFFYYAAFEASLKNSLGKIWSFDKAHL